MPGRDGTGPMGAGPMTGRGFGGCYAGYGRGAGFAGYGFGRGMGRGIGCRGGIGRGFGRFFGFQPEFDAQNVMSEKELLEEQKKFLEAQLDAINKKMQE